MLCRLPAWTLNMNLELIISVFIKENCPAIRWGLCGYRTTTISLCSMLSFVAKEGKKLCNFYSFTERISSALLRSQEQSDEEMFSNSAQSENSQQLLVASKRRRKSKKQKNIVFWESRISFMVRLCFCFFPFWLWLARERVNELASRSVRKEVYRKLANSIVVSFFSAKL